jgi:hypothetical protein
MAAKKAPAKKPKAPPEKVLACGLDKDDDKYLYFVDKRGNITRMARGVAKAQTEIILKTGIRRQRGFMYYLDDEGDLVREPDSSRDS